MIRLALRQFRTQALVGVVVLAATLAVALATRGHITHLYDTTVRGCSAKGDCDQVIAAFTHQTQSLRGWLGIVVVVVPGLLGLFWAAPLVSREVESGTFRLAWTQSITRTRWLLAKVAVVGAATMLVAGLVSLIVSWWAALPDRARQDAFGSFDQRDIVPIGHAAFAFALGLAAGVIIKRVLPAMATTLVVFVTVRLTANTWVRPNLLTPKVLEVQIAGRQMGFGSVDGGEMTLHAEPPFQPDVWFRSVELVRKDGHILTPADVTAACPDLTDLARPRSGPGDGVPTRAPDGLRDALQGCIDELATTYHEVVTFHPADRYWPLQWIETGLYVAAAVALIGVASWWVRRRLS